MCYLFVNEKKQLTVSTVRCILQIRSQMRLLKLNNLRFFVVSTQKHRVCTDVKTDMGGVCLFVVWVKAAQIDGWRSRVGGVTVLI